MKSVLRIAAMTIGLLCCAAALPAQTVTVMSNNLQSGGAPFTGMLSFIPVTSSGVALQGYQLPGGGVATGAPSSVYAQAGVFSIALPDTALTAPKNICFRVPQLGVGYQCIQPSATGQSSWCTTVGSVTTCDLGKYVPNLPFVTMQVGPPGPAGPNTITSGTSTPIVGLLKGAGGTVAQAVAGTDYVAPGTDLPLSGGTLAGPLNGVTGQFSNYMEAGAGSGATVVTPGQGVWKRIGVVTYPLVNQAQESTVWYEGGCLILTTLANCFKHTYSEGLGIDYGESSDGIVWTPGVSTGVNQRPSREFKIGSTYYLFAANTAQTQIDEFTSTNGENYTLAYAGVITAAMIPSAWGGTQLDNASAVMVGSTLYLAVDMEFNSGLWSSTDYHTFTPVADIMP